MRWIKAVAIVVAAMVALAVVSAVMHLITLAVVAIVIGAAVVVAFKAWGKLRNIGGRGRQAEAPPSPRMAPPQLDIPPRAVPKADDVEAELARLKREME